MISLQEVTNWTSGKILLQGLNEFAGVGTDSRNDLEGKIFIALRGEKFDAHEFLVSALDRDPAAIMIDQKEKFDLLVEENKISLFKDKNVSVILVDDTLKGLQDLASNYRKKMGARIIAITGSNGKTTSKEFTAQLLGQFFSVHFNVGSFNNHWGVPLSLLQINPEHELAIIEMGMDHYHEIENLVKLADPDIVVCTMVGNAHIENFGSLENIAKAKEEIYEFSKKEAIRIFNLDNSYTRKMFEKYRNISKNFTFSSSSESVDVAIKVKESLIDYLKIHGRIEKVQDEVQVDVFGEQNITNIMVAATIALALEVSPEKIWKALMKIKTNWGRNQFINSDKGCKILFDGYNANFDSMTSLLNNFSKLKAPGLKVAVLAEMLAIGEKSDEFHNAIGALAVKSGFDNILFYGKPYRAFLAGVQCEADKMGKKINCFVSETLTEELYQQIEKLDNSKNLICVKGSRGMETERVIKRLVKAFSSK